MYSGINDTELGITTKSRAEKIAECYKKLPRADLSAARYASVNTMGELVIGSSNTLNCVVLKVEEAKKLIKFLEENYK